MSAGVRASPPPLTPLVVPQAGVGHGGQHPALLGKPVGGKPRGLRAVQAGEYPSLIGAGGFAHGPLPRVNETRVADDDQQAVGPLGGGLI